MMFSKLANRTALVTGASQGIGRAIARRLAAHGARVVVSASGRAPDLLDETCGLIAAQGGTAAPLLADLSDQCARADIIHRAEQLFGPLDILVNNAALVGAYAPPSKIDLAARHAAFEVNFEAPVDLMQQVLPGMRERSWGRILNISSETVKQPPPPYVGPPKMIHALVAYGASKAALNRYSAGLAAELHGSGVHVNAVAPYKIAWSENADQIARATLAFRPDWVEGVEMMAEAAYILISGNHTGFIGTSREALYLNQTPLHGLDGETVLGDASTLVTGNGG
ncbi:MAG: SDR family NAD(P)-dependent oxidoreductase [Hyphomonadaceae bacterium]|nr:SDR family NAD(P)-dependent oxidoreductase [Hyphomonadaceae bacterium]